MNNIQLKTNPPTDTPDPLISVIVPIYHAEKYLRRCLDSLLRQSMREFEIVLVNDGGNEAETAICEEYAARDPRIVCHRQENRGVSAARNTGLSLARGKWIMFADSDDWVHEDFCRKALEAVMDNGAQMAIFDLVYTRNEIGKGALGRSSLDEGVYPASVILRERLKQGIPCYLCNKLYDRTLWDGIRFPEGELWEDDAVIHLVIDRAETVVILHEALYFYAQHEGSITNCAYRSGEVSRWRYIQRCRRYDYLCKNHPELIDIESGFMSSVALKYAAYLAIENRPDEMNTVTEWLRDHDLLHPRLSRAKTVAYAMLMQSPELFARAMKAYNLLTHKIV